MFYDWKTAGSFAKMAMVTADRLNLTGVGEPEQIAAAGVSGEFFQVLGAPALLGRPLLPEDNNKGKRATVLLAHYFWQSRFGGDRGIVGRTVHLDGVALTVVGVMPPEFVFPRGGEMPTGYGFAARPDVWVPMALPPERRQTRGNRRQLAIGLLKPGVSIPTAQAEMNAIADRIEKIFPASDTG